MEQNPTENKMVCYNFSILKTVAAEREKMSKETKWEGGEGNEAGAVALEMDE